MTTTQAWRADPATVADVLDALDDLRRAAERGATRTAVMTLVVVGSTSTSLDRAVAGLHDLGSKHPARCLVIQTEPDAAPGLDAEIDLHRVADNGDRVVSEDVRLRVRGPATRHLDSLIEPFTLPDLPVVVWFVDELPAPSDPVVGAADVVVVDSRDFGGLECFAAVRLIGSQRPVTDLSWVRLQPWRAALRSALDAPMLSPLLRHIESAEVHGKTGPRHLIAGWLADRLDLALADIHLVEAEHVSIRLRAEHEGHRGSAAVLREAGDRTLRIEGHVEGGGSFAATQQLPPAGPAWGLTEALSRLVRDPVFEGALGAALDF